jgi:hypothetical protein
VLGLKGYGFMVEVYPVGSWEWKPNCCAASHRNSRLWCMQVFSVYQLFIPSAKSFTLTLTITSYPFRPSTLGA